MITDFEIPAVRSMTIADRPGLVEAADTLGFPLALKTAEDGIAHKSDQGGVVLNLGSLHQVKDAYVQMTQTIGPKAILQQMAAKGIELSFGYVADPDFGPIVMVSAGGTLIEILADRQVAIPPFGPGTALTLIGKLKVSSLLDGARGAQPVDREALAQALSRFSVLCSLLGEHLSEMDINPVIATPTGITAVDALVIPSNSRH